MSTAARLTARPGEVLSDMVEDAPEDVVKPVDRRSSDPINVLSRRLGSVTTTALDSYEIAAAIEARGINDDMARREYGRKDVFDLAAAIYRRAPLHPARSRMRHEFDHIGRRRTLRGLLFALPGVLFFPLARLTDTESAAVVFVCVTLLGWIASQGVSSLAHHQSARIGISAMHAVLRVALIIGVIGTVGTCATAIALGQSPTLVIAGGAQMTYLLGAIVLLTLDHDPRLASILVPFTAVALVLSLISGVPAWLVSGVVVGASVLLVVVAFRTTDQSQWSPVQMGDVGRSLVMALYGVLLGLLIASPILILLVTDGTVTMWLGAAALPITLSMGSAERRFVQVRIANREHLQRAEDPREYSRAAAGRFLRALGGYVAVLVTITALFLAVGSLIASPDRTALIVIASYVVLGAGMFGALIVVNSGGAHRLTAVLAVSVAAVAAFHGGELVFLVVVLGVATAFIAFGMRTSRQVTAAR